MSWKYDGEKCWRKGPHIIELDHDGTFILYFDGGNGLEVIRDRIKCLCSAKDAASAHGASGR